MFSYRNTSQEKTPWLVYHKPNPQAKLRLFCFPYAGGGASIFRRWLYNLPTTIEICPIQIPGRETRLREAPFNRLLPLVQTIAQTFSSYIDKPFAFFGHSMGALLGFELARQVRREYNIEPTQLFVSGRCAPQIISTDPVNFNLPEHAFVEELRRLNGTPKEVLDHSELRDLMLPIIRSDFAICQTYIYSDETPLSCPISAFGGLQDSEVSPNQLRAWSEQTSASFKLRMLPGDHFFLHTAQPMLLQMLSQDLLQILSRIY